MKTLIIATLTGALLVGCATTETGTTNREGDATVYALDDQPQTATAGEGSLMPGAYGSRDLPTGQFTGRERTNDQVGQRPTLPREADARELARGEESLATGAGTLGQSGIVPNEPVSTETLMETSAPPITQSDESAARTRQSQIPAQGIGSPPLNQQGRDSSTNTVDTSDSTVGTEQEPRPE
jgi:hypothetical protein